MKNVFYLKLLLLLFFFSYNVQAQVAVGSGYDWRDDPYVKESARVEKINRAVRDINMTYWGYTDYFEEAYSSFIEGGSYYSDRNDLGVSTYLVLNMNGNQYIFKNIPYNIWKGLKEASSKGEFYNYYIRGSYYSL